MAAVKDRRVSDGSTENLKVFVRLRPLNKRELAANESVSVQAVSARRATIITGPAHKPNATEFDYDGVFGCDTDQQTVYEHCVQPYVDEILQGYSCVVFAYGQTGTGKTHTMQGTYGDNRADASGHGMIPRVSKDIFHRLNEMKADFTLQVSCIELYNEELKDLLCRPGSEKPIKIQDSGNPHTGEVLMNVAEVPVTNVDEIYNTLLKAMARRATAHTGMNDRSSRSHALFSLKVNIKDVDPVTGDQRIKIGQLNLVDLAGSECSSDSKSRGRRAAEAKNINRSLVTLGRVMTALVKKDSYVPYRDSKLTRLLKESLGGAARACVIATVSPCRSAAKESKNTLIYAQNAKEIRNRPVQNCQLSQATLIKNLEAEINSWKRKYKIQIAKDGIVIDKESYEARKAEMQVLRAQTVEQAAALAEAKAEVESLRTAAQHEHAGVRAAWQSVVGAGGDSAGATDAPSMKDLADALAAAKEETEAMRAERDAALAAQHATAGQIAAVQQKAGKQGSVLTSLQDQVDALSQENARLEAQIADLSASLSAARNEASGANRKHKDSVHAFDSLITTIEAAMVQARKGVVGRTRVSLGRSGSIPCTPRTAGERSSTENDAPSNERRISQGVEIFTAATTASPLKYGGKPCQHVPATPQAFTTKNMNQNTGGSTGSSAGHSQLKKILSLASEYKSSRGSRLQELRKSEKVTRSQSLEAPLRARLPMEGRLLQQRPSGAFATRRNSAR